MDKFLDCEPHKLQRQFHKPKQSIQWGYFSGYRGAKTYAQAQLVKDLRLIGIKSLVLIPNLRSMDNMINLGIQPSELAMPSEFVNTSRFDAMSIILKEVITNGGNS